AACKVQGAGWSLVLETVVGGERLGRYSGVGSGPFRRFQAHGKRVQIYAPPPGAPAGSATLTELEHPDPLRLLEERLSAYRAPALAGLQRFYGVVDGSRRCDVGWCSSLVQQRPIV